MPGWLALSACVSPEPAARPVHDTLPMASALAERGMTLWEPEDLALGWVETVWFYALHRLYRKTGDERWQEAYRRWLSSSLPDFLADPARIFDSSDEASPAILASLLLQEDPDAGVEPIVAAGHERLARAPRTDEGAICHWGEDSLLGEDQVWIDSQFMFGMFLLAEADRGEETLPLWAEQYALFSQLCRDEGARLYRHAYDDETDSNVPQEPVYWNRGNSWVLVSAAEALSRLPDPETVQPQLLAHAEAIRALQAEDGLYKTVLNDPVPGDPANYTETSGSALIGYAQALALQQGALPESHRASLDRLVDGVLARIDPEGPVLHGTSFGTNPGEYDYYVSVPVLDDALLGFGAAVLLLSEVDGQPRGETP
jgi:unsaturated rhamnogalacturonyl hydrolase